MYAHISFMLLDMMDVILLQTGQYTVQHIGTYII